jgi:hypothetical protein
MVDMVIKLTGCGIDEAFKALTEYNSVEDAVDALLSKPLVSGDKYIPTKPKIETGLTEEQKERCKKGRWLQDQVNAVFSVAHSKIQSPQVPLAQQLDDTPAAAIAQEETASQIATGESLPDFDEKMSPLTQQSEKLQ